MKVLVTGGAGYIGSHAVIELLNQNHDVIVDNFQIQLIKRLENITNKSCELENIDIRDKKNLISAFKKFKPDLVIHFAGLKSVGDSVKDPMSYYDNNFFDHYHYFKQWIR